jgi:hypothetical protein
VMTGQMGRLVGPGGGADLGDLLAELLQPQVAQHCVVEEAAVPGPVVPVVGVPGKLEVPDERHTVVRVCRGGGVIRLVWPGWLRFEQWVFG